MARSVGRHRWELALFALFALLFGTWIVGVPRYAVPDEPAHTVKAYGTAHGQTIGIPIEGLSSLTRAFIVPLTLASGDPGCYAFSANIPAFCSIPNDDRTISGVATTAATYPPAYYAVVGGLTRLTGQDTSVRAYRTFSALTSAAILVAAFVLAARLGRGRPAILLLALTPMAVFLLPSVNPTSWEISGMLLLWVYLATLCLQPHVAGKRQLMIASVIGALVILVRPIALPWVAIALLAYLVMERRQLAPDRRALLRLLAVAAVPLAIAVIASAAWSRYAGVALTDDKYASDASTVDVFRLGLGRTGWLFDQAIGVLGWVDTAIPTGSVALWLFGFALALAVVLFSGSIRVRWVTAALAAIWILYPALYVTAAGTPEVWQGRYNLPLLGGLVFCALLCGTGTHGAKQLERVATYLAGAFVVIEGLAFHQTLRRFMVGAEGDILLRYRAWWPGIEAWVLIGLNVAAAAGIALLVRRSPDRTLFEMPSADGGRLLPGVDLNDSAALTEL